MSSVQIRDRIAALVVVSRDLSVRDITRIVGLEPDDFREVGSIRSGIFMSRPAKDNSWELRERSDPSIALSVLIDRLSSRIIPLRAQFADLKNHGCIIKLELVQWVSALQDVGSGFALDQELVELLSAIGASIDVDQYVE